MTKTANLIVVGGTIAAGKSTLVQGISQRLGWNPVPELRPDDVVQEIILKKLYEGTRIHKATVQYYFILNRYNQYKEESGGIVTSILDRGPWEDWFFALLLMKDDPKSYEHYKKIWKKTMQKIVLEFGLPKAYIYTKLDWESFQNRIFLRGRESEIKNFSANKNYFKNLLDAYNQNFENLLQQWNIKPIVIDTTKLNKQQVLETAIQELKKVGAY